MSLNEFDTGGQVLGRIEPGDTIAEQHYRKLSRIHIGVLTIPAATILAINSIPKDTTVPGALFWSALLMTAGLLSGAVIDVVEGGLAQVFRIPNLVAFGLIAIAYSELLQFSYVTALDPEIVRETFLAIGVFGTAMAIGCSIRPPRLPRVITELAERSYSPNLLFYIMIACWLIAMFNYLYAADFSYREIIDGLMAPRFSAPWNRGKLGDETAFLDFLSNFGYLVPAFTVTLALVYGSWTHFRVIVGIVCSIIFLAFIAQGGGRRQIAAIIGAAALTWFCAKMKSLRLQHYAIAGALILATGLLLNFMLQERGMGFGDYESAQPSLDDDLDIEPAFQVDNNFQSLGETLNAIPAHADFVGLPFIEYVLVRPVPRLLWPGKPVDQGFDLADYLGLQGVSLAITAIGESYMSFGWFGIVGGGLIFGLLSNFWLQLADRDYGPMGSVLYSLGAMILVIGTRSFTEVILMAYPLGCWYVLDRVFWQWSSRH